MNQSLILSVLIENTELVRPFSSAIHILDTLEPKKTGALSTLCLIDLEGVTAERNDKQDISFH